MNINQKIAEVERILDYVFVNELLCAEAIQMAAPVSALSINGRTHFVPANKRLSVLGDAIATSVLCKAWYSYRDENGRLQTPAAWTHIRQGALNNETLAQLGRELGLGRTIVASGGHFGPPGTTMMATAVEALLGAVYEDGGEAAVSGVMDHMGLAQHLVMSKYLSPHQP